MNFEYFGLIGDEATDVSTLGLRHVPYNVRIALLESVP
jgi:hypothetical protein